MTTSPDFTSPEAKAFYQSRVASFGLIIGLAGAIGLGFRVAIEDVGAGYSSLNSIAMLAPDVVKIDMALCAGVSTDPVKQRLLRSMVSAFRELGSLIIAEGVETPDDFAELQGVRCDLFQGYLFAKPGPAYPMVA